MSWDAEDAVREVRRVLADMRERAKDEQHQSQDSRRAYRDCAIAIITALEGP